MEAVGWSKIVIFKPSNIDNKINNIGQIGKLKPTTKGLIVFLPINGVTIIVTVAENIIDY